MQHVALILPDPPADVRARQWWQSRLFHACVVAPTLAAALWYGIFASDVYVSESRFVVRGPDRVPQGALGALLDGAAAARTTGEGYAAESYLTSRDALAALNAGGAYARAHAGTGLSQLDRFDPWHMAGSFEDLYRYYRAHVAVDSDATTGIVVLSVRSFSANNAQAFNARLLALAEASVNRMSARRRQDRIATALAEVAEARDAAREAGAALARYRNRAGVLDPEKQAPIQYELVARLQDELIEARSDRRQLASVAPQSPQLAALDARIGEVAHRLAEQQGLAAGNAHSSLAARGEVYARLALDADFAARRLSAALGALQTAEADAQAQSSYVERVVEPGRPDRAIEPQRVRAVLTTLIAALIVWGCAAMLIAGVREHAQ